MQFFSKPPRLFTGVMFSNKANRSTVQTYRHFLVDAMESRSSWIGSVSLVGGGILLTKTIDAKKSSDMSTLYKTKKDIRVLGSREWPFKGLFGVSGNTPG